MNMCSSPCAGSVRHYKTDTMLLPSTTVEDCAARLHKMCLWIREQGVQCNMFTPAKGSHKVMYNILRGNNTGIEMVLLCTDDCARTSSGEAPHD
jgi:hypothetical protein